MPAIDQLDERSSKCLYALCRAAFFGKTQTRRRGHALGIVTHAATGLFENRVKLFCELKGLRTGSQGARSEEKEEA